MSKPFNRLVEMVHREQHSGRNEHILVGSWVIWPKDGYPPWLKL
jgi:hypothetical protein